jgi:ankyrin repeat protein
MYAALYGSPTLVKQLLDAGADPNVRNQAGATALTWAHPDAIRSALERGADVNPRDAKSRTPLMLAAIVDTLPAASVRLLLDSGADPAAKDPNGRAHANVTPVNLNGPPKAGPPPSPRGR